MSDTQPHMLAVVGRTYRGILISQDGNEFVILSETGQRFVFISWNEACAFVDVWYAAYAAGEAMIYTA